MFLYQNAKGSLRFSKPKIQYSKSGRKTAKSRHYTVQFSQNAASLARSGLKAGTLNRTGVRLKSGFAFEPGLGCGKQAHRGFSLRMALCGRHIGITPFERLQFIGGTRGDDGI